VKVRRKRPRAAGRDVTVYGNTGKVKAEKKRTGQRLDFEA
jgi:hypothetical protein